MQTAIAVLFAAVFSIGQHAPARVGQLGPGMHELASFKPNDAKRPTVCLIHGINSSSYSFVHMIPLLEEAGFGVVVYDFPFNQDLDVTCPRFVQDWQALREKTADKQPWAIVTHSMGGLLARFYVEGADYGGDVSRLVLIAPPNQGSSIAQAQTLLQIIQRLKAMDAKQNDALADVLRGVGESASDMRAGSAFLKRLNARNRRDGVVYSILAGDSGFITIDARKQIEAQTKLLTKGSGLLGGIGRMAAGDITAALDALADGTGDGCVTVASTKLDGVKDHQTIHANHVELIRGPLLYPDPGPVAAMPFVLERLNARTPAEKRSSNRSR